MNCFSIQKNIMFITISLILVAQCFADESINKLKSIKTDISEKNEFRMIILSEYPIKKYKSFSLLDETPPKLVIDLSGRWKSHEKAVIKLTSNDMAKNIRIGEHPDHIRVVLDLKINESVSPIFEEISEGLLIKIGKNNQNKVHNDKQDSFALNSDKEDNKHIQKFPEKETSEKLNNKQNITGENEAMSYRKEQDNQKTNVVLKNPAFQLRVSSGYLYYEYQEKLATYRDYMPFIGIGANMIFGKFNIDSYYQFLTRSGSDSSTNSDTTHDEIVGDVTSIVNLAPQFNRQDYSFSIGYSILGNKPAITDKYLLQYLSRENSIIDTLTIFAGYKGGKARFDFGKNKMTISNKYYSEYYIIFDENEASYTIFGPFLGISCGKKVFENGLLSFNLATSYLSMDFRQTAKVIMQNGDQVSQPPNEYSKSGVIGFTFGVEFYAPITENLFYNISIGGYRYDFDDYVEKIFQSRFGLVYSF